MFVALDDDRLSPRRGEMFVALDDDRLSPRRGEMFVACSIAHTTPTGSVLSPVGFYKH